MQPIFDRFWGARIYTALNKFKDTDFFCSF